MKHMRKTNQFAKRVIAMLLAIVLIATGVRPLTINAMAPNTPVEKIDFKDFSNWRSGMYELYAGKYVSYLTRICLNDYATVDGGEFKVVITDGRFHLLIRELNKSKGFIKSCDLINGMVYTPSSNAAYLGISIYKSGGESGVTYSTYKDLFANGFYAGLETDKNEETSTTPPSDSSSETGNETDKTETDESENESEEIENTVYDIVKINYKNFSNWKSGMYDLYAGKYVSYPTRICLNDYVTVDGGEYKACVKDSNYRLLIRELNKNKAFIKSYNLANGQSYTPSASAAYLGISIYKLSGESSVSYSTFKTLFANGFYAGLEVVEEEEIVEEEEQILDSSINEKLDNDTAKDNDTLFKEELLEMLTTGDTTSHNIAKYGYSDWKKVSELYNEVIKNEGMVAYNSCYNMYYSTTKNGSGVIQTIKLENIDSGYVKRYESMKKIVDDLVEQSAGMTEVEKVVLAHDYVAANCQYSNTGNLAYTAAGALVDKKAICVGYSRALIVLLKSMGVEAEYVSSQAINHAWVKVKVNGNWYHADPTWANTRSSVSGQVTHAFLLRTDEEYLNASSNRHYGWDGTVSTDQSFTNWNVHDIIGQLKYENGSWYYINYKNGQKTEVDINK